MANWKPKPGFTGLTPGQMGIIAAGALSRLPSAGRPGASGSLPSQGTRFVWARQKTKRKLGKSGRFRKMMLKQEVTQHTTIPDTTITSAVTHNNIYTISPTQFPAQGTSNTARYGDAIHLMALKVKGVMVTPTTANGYQYRFIVGWSTKQVANTTFVTGVLAAADIFLPSTGSFFQTNGIVNPKAFTALYDEVVDVNSLVTATSDIFNLEFTVQLDQKFEYVSSGSAFGKNRDLYFILIPIVNGGTTNVTACGTAAFAMDLLFKNSN